MGNDFDSIAVGFLKIDRIVSVKNVDSGSGGDAKDIVSDSHIHLDGNKVAALKKLAPLEFWRLRVPNSPCWVPLANAAMVHRFEFTYSNGHIIPVETKMGVPIYGGTGCGPR